MSELEVIVTFTNDQALVLSDWLDRVLGTDRFDGIVDEDPAVWAPLYKLAGTLETTLPHIFAAGYAQRLGRARQRLLAGPVTWRAAADARRSAGQGEPGIEREVAGWVQEANLVAVLEHLSRFVGYRFDHLDETALVGALGQTDDDTADRWFEYPLQGSPPLTVRMAGAAGSTVVTLFVCGGIEDVLAARIETLLDLL